MGKIVAIGGGSMVELETLGIDEEVVRLAGKPRPKALFIPTASSDNPERWDIFQQVYGERLGCDTDVLLLLGMSLAPQELEEKILSADLIYVGGGNTLKMMRRWRWLGMDRLLEQAYSRGTVLSGLSVGAICWFRYGHSDSMSFYKT
jgi:dipeptidase E